MFTDSSDMKWWSCFKRQQILMGVLILFLAGLGVWFVIDFQAAPRSQLPPVFLDAVPVPEASVSVLPLSNNLLPPAQSCVRTGCHDQQCVDASFNLPALNIVPEECPWQAEFACYQQAKCEVQVTGQCGFTQTSELASCVATSRARSPLIKDQ
jgi:hypothetical protein